MLLYLWGSQCPRGLRRRSAPIRLLGLRVRILPTALTSVSCECYLVQASASGWSLDQRSPTAYVLSECDCEAPTMRRPLPTRGCEAMGGKNSSINYQHGICAKFKFNFLSDFNTQRILFRDINNYINRYSLPHLQGQAVTILEIS